ncbi:phosphoglycerate kinase [Mycoplasmopsis opalescens]|uniref:phosphoglycerate kinase n=1 Tax=Mycoplasmopsis opalescens TaxID=114886 RepID=UPI0004A7319C|nr:phosphoglycerate kinase [Mycoplasmopsis opalescens]
MKETIDNLKLDNKTVLMRVDFNVPIKEGKITSNKRILAALPTIKKALESKVKLVLFSHLGRIKEEADKEKNNLEPVALELAKHLKNQVTFVNETRGQKLENAIKNMNYGEVILVQNTRYEDLNNKAESKNSDELGAYWASLGDVFINDAFGTAHRAHASNVGIAKHISESAIGYLIAKETSALSKALVNPEKPYIAIIGGAKVSDKIKVLEHLVTLVDKIIIGGGMAYTFLKSQGYKVGKSLVEDDFLAFATDFLAKYRDKVILPVDHAISEEFADTDPKYTNDANIDDNFMALDLGPQSIDLFTKTLKNVKTVVWNGPMGVTEFNNYAAGTLAIANALAKENQAYTIVGGGDSVAAIQKLKMEQYFSHISTGGGASLEFLEGKTLPGFDTIQNL